MSFRSLIATLATVAALVLPAPADAGQYWWNADASLMTAANGFTWQGDANLYSYWGTHCENKAVSIPATNGCSFVWNVPAGLDASSGAMQGQYRHANQYFRLQMIVEGNGNSIVDGDTNTRSFNRQWADMGGSLVFKTDPTATTTPSAATNWFTASAIQVLLSDPTLPVANVLAGQDGWKGPSGTCVTYGFGDSGSGVQATSLTNLTTGQAVHSWNPGGSNVTSGYGQATHAPCFAAPGNGTFTYRMSASDKSGNAASLDFNISFDTAAPRVSGISSAGTAVDPGRVFRGSAGQYRPGFHLDYDDAGGSGIAYAQVWVDGAHVGSGPDWTPGADLALGAHTITWHIGDAVGNVTDVSRSFVVVDDVRPTLAVAAPAASGANQPVLDVTAADDRSGVDTGTWTVKVDGDLLVATSSTDRLQADIGYLVDGTHTIDISVRDGSGNEVTQNLTYVADSGPNIPQLPAGFTTGIYVYDTPTAVTEGETYRVKALFVKRGRPALGRVEVRKGADTLAGADVEATGAADLAVTINTAGPLTLNAPPGSGLEPVTFDYTYTPKPAATCATDPTKCGGGGLDACKGAAAQGCGGASGANGAGGANGAAGGAGTGGAGGSQGANGGAGGNGQPAGANANGPNGYPANVVYYVGQVPYWNGIPLAESGAPLDAIAPAWTLTLVQQKKGVVRKKRAISMRLWTSELSIVNLLPVDSRGRAIAANRTTASARRASRPIAISIGPRTILGRQLARARAGSFMTVRIRIRATDKRGNSSRVKVATFRVRV